MSIAIATELILASSLCLFLLGELEFDASLASVHVAGQMLHAPLIKKLHEG
jgi:hypothetical protein